MYMQQMYKNMTNQSNLSLDEKISFLKKVHCHIQGTSLRQLNELIFVPRYTVLKLLKEDA